MEVTFTVPGDPKVKRRPRFGRGRTYSDPDQKAAEAVIVTYFRRSVGPWTPRPDMLHMDCRFYVATRRRRDTDNLVKMVRDALNAAAYVDDSQVTSGTEQVIHDPDNPRTVIRLRFTGRNRWP